MPTTTWAALPVHVRAAVTSRTGMVTAAYDVADGYNCHAAAVLTAGAGPVFVKVTAAGAAADREVLAGPVVAAVGPRFRWHLRVDGWRLLGHDALVDPRHTQLGPDSNDLLLLADTLTRASALPAPGGLPVWADQWAGHVTPHERALLDGDRLVHGDINQHNAVVSNGRVWLVDWATASRGPAWADTAEAAIRTMEDGCTADQAEAVAARVPAWRAASPAAVQAWADARCRAWTATIGAHDARHSNRRHQALAAAHRAAHVVP